jgi:hypothetical protein
MFDSEAQGIECHAGCKKAGSESLCRASLDDGRVNMGPCQACTETADCNAGTSNRAHRHKSDSHVTLMCNVVLPMCDVCRQ